MAEQAGAGVAAAKHREAVLAGRFTTVAGADSQLQTVLRDGHEVVMQYGRRLDAIKRAIDNAVARQGSLALDTPAGAREFQRFLSARHKEILDVVTDAQRSDAAQQAQVDALTTHYAIPTDFRTPAPDSPQQEDPPHGKDPRYWIDLDKIIHVPPGQLAPYGTKQIGPGLFYPIGSPYDYSPPPDPAKHPLDIADIRQLLRDTHFEHGGDALRAHGVVGFRASP